MKEQEIITLIAKSLSQETMTSEEQSQLAGLLQEKQHQELYQHLKIQWDSYQDDRSRYQSSQAKAYQLVQQRIGKKPAVKHNLNLIYRIAASIAIVAVLGLSIFLIQQNQQSPSEHQVALVKYQTGKGEKNRTTLPDQSEIVLNAESSLQFDKNFRTSRSFKLEGEAYFKVARNPDKPFLVHFNGYQLKVLGTTFNVNAYQPDRSSISLMEGSLQVSGPGLTKPVLLAPGEQINLQNNTGEFEIQTFDKLAVAGWKDNILVFKQEPLGTVARRLERHYGVTIQIEKDALRNCLISLNADNQPLNVVLEVIRYAGDFEYEQVDRNTIRLSGNGCN